MIHQVSIGGLFLNEIMKEGNDTKEKHLAH